MIKAKFLVHDKANIKKIVSFLFVGGTTAVLYFLFCFLLYDCYELNNFFAVSCAYFISVIFHFLANRLFTFNSIGIDITSQLKNYSILLILNYLITVFFTQGALAMQMSPYIGMIIAIAINVAIGYPICNFWIFRKSI